MIVERAWVKDHPKDPIVEIKEINNLEEKIKEEKKEALNPKDEENKQDEDDKKSVESLETIKDGLSRDIDIEKNEELSSNLVSQIWKYAKVYIFNIGITYFLGYVIVHFMIVIEQKKYIDSPTKQYMYYNLGYQIGVFISRSSVKIVKKIGSIWILTILQSINFIFWLFLSLFGFIQSFVAIFILCISVGLIGGGAYVYGYFLIYEDKEIENKLREQCLNAAFFVSEGFLIMSSLFSLLFDEIVL